MRNEIAKFVKESVEWLQEEQQGCCTYKLDDHLAVCVGWSAGYGDEERDIVIQAKDNLDYGINVGIKVWTSDASMLTDYDWINFPYYEDGEVLDMGLSIVPNENYNVVADSLLKWYGEVEDLVLADDGKVLKDDRYITRYKCKYCDFSYWDIDNDVEEELWGHIQMHHEDKFEEVQNWETPDMIEECYEEEI